MKIEDDKGLLGANWFVILVSALIAWATVLTVAITFLRAIVGTHPSWWWAIGPLLLAFVIYVVHVVYGLIFAPRYNPGLHERLGIHEEEDDRDA